jgi:histidinol-phosphate/aromatic aminotransferase/cobyric acid decarboxylase-like protein
MTTIETRPATACYHGGAFWDELGDDLTNLEDRERIIAADVLDAWFDPSPRVIQRVAECLPFALRASPPTNAGGMERVIASHREVPDECVLAGAGSSDLIFAALRRFITPDSRVLILDPMYGEYAHVLEQVIGARVDRLALHRESSYDVPIDGLRRRIADGYDWVVLVNPNSPTGRHTDGRALMLLAADAPPDTRFWIDETYVDYVDSRASVERLAVQTHNVVVCKSMSKAYALSGARAAYLCGAREIIDELRSISPPWSVSLPAQIAACEALRDGEYYRARWKETAELRHDLEAGLRSLGCDVVPGCANFLLCELPPDAPTAADVARTVREQGLLIRDVSSMGQRFGPRAFRIAVKDASTNGRMLRMLEAAL